VATQSSFICTYVLVLLFSLLETVEIALKSAVDAGKERSESADTAFGAAEEHLDQYAAWYHPEQECVSCYHLARRQ
jgi:hypothetical protein